MKKQDSQPVDLAEQSVTRLKGVGARNAEKLARLNIETVQDLLFHLPLRYQDRTRIQPIGAIRRGDQVVIEGEVDVTEIKFGRRRSLLVRISDGTGGIILRFFYFSNAQREALARGVRLRCFGEVRNGPNSLEMVHPEYQRVDPDEPQQVEETLTPLYPTTEGVHQLTLRGLMQQALTMLEQTPQGLRELLPGELLSRFPMQSLALAVSYLHRPPPDADQQELLAGSHPAQQRLTFEELLAHQISLRKLRSQHQQISATVLPAGSELKRQLLANIPFKLTPAQERVVGEIEQDLSKPNPMQRLVQGDVGSGKTIVSALAALQAIDAGSQVALMAPTELLAEQHLNSFSQWLEPMGIQIAWLTGRMKGRAREQVLEVIATGQVQLVVGTHALFQDDVVFDDLGLVIIDEQHRFGVHQRLALREKGRRQGHAPHQLIMTATPIPRTLAMTAYADLDLSVIDSLPPGRKPVTTAVISDRRRDEVVERVRAACAEGRQAYWVCTLIEESEVLQCQAAEESAQQLAEALPELRVGLVHGRIKSEQKEQVMSRFKAGELDLLIATTVIEVGVDVPNASLMIIENAERLGLAQLHQLRGRVGRGSAESHCVLMYHAPLSLNAKTRLAILRESSDGFYIAQKDLEMRGPGEVLGTRQTGDMQLRIADLVRDQGMLDEVREVAERMLQDHPLQAEQLVLRWLGRRVDYGRA
ncbi:MAG: ATP-dependent DNA helicase RecG [Candidatus Thiodiazotropha sp. (ex Myrtea sp. 'scaly one' KF741663)]|nr:ATP-dependent DNA helicase RecG [Candidatus Thiodiazotropha sp. (ex Myrtea sp. 'scaly one' KF741663)]